VNPDKNGSQHFVSKFSFWVFRFPYFAEGLRLNPDDQVDSLVSELSELFYPAAELGQFQKVDADEMPQQARGLLAHEFHMTVTLEQFHDCAVDLQVLQSRYDGDHYSRKILLTRQSDNHIVMFGIVRMNLAVMAPHVRKEIESQRIPLGRTLIENNVLREVKLLSLFCIEPGSDLSSLLGLKNGQACYGRTALIYCGEQPAIELLEIV